MSEEEKKAIHLLQSYTGMTHKLTDNQGRPKLDQAIEKALNLIERQQKEIEKLKAKNKKYEKLNLTEYKLEPDGNLLSKTIELDDYIYKDKIKEKIRELEDDKYEYLVARENIIKTLQELLEGETNK